jgi:sigma-E factor negative regulatory protein RseA
MNQQAQPRTDAEVPSRRQRLSMLMDGEASIDDARALLAGWQEEAEVRADWHAWHVAGDVMRSTDPWVSGTGRGDAAFLVSLRERLAAEPVPLAPAPLAEPTPAPQVRPAVVRPLARRVMAPVAVAAGFVAVAGVLVVFRAGGPGTDGTAGTTLAESTPPAAVAVQAPANANALVSTGVQPDGRAKVLRDARLDRYLSVHRPAVNVDSVEAVGGRSPIVLER